MEIYNEEMERIEAPDLSLGWLENTVRMIRHDAVEGVPEAWHYETLAEYPNGGKDVVRVIDIPGVEAKAAWEEEIPIQIYHPYTREELDEREEETQKTTIEERLADMEAALEMILAGVVE